MIIYFSSTGNCKFAAEKIASATKDRAVSITEIEDGITLRDGEQLGIITPTYFWGLPTFVDDFLKKIKIENANKSYIFYTATYGTTPGRTDYFVNKHLKAKGLGLSASYKIKTVDNWTVWFDVSDKGKIEKLLKYEGIQLENVIQSIKEQRCVFFGKGSVGVLLCRMAKYFYNRSRRTKHLHVNGDCIGCRLCQDRCPTKSIRVYEDRPVWGDKQCTMCLGCLHSCPVFAIQYDNKTRKHGQYRHPN